MRVGLMLLVWFVVALAIGATGALRQLRPPAPQVILVSLTIALLVAWRLAPPFRRWLEMVDLRLLIGIHVTRFVGFYFLILCGRDELPCSFATTAGWGDILVAIGATVLLAFCKLTRSRALLLAWNLFGLLDILFVVASATRHGMTDPSSMAALLRLPLSLLVTFLVPLIIASHIFIFSRLWGKERL